MQAANETQYLPGLGVAAEGLLRKDLPAVDVDLEHAAGGFDQLHLGLRVGLTNLGRQTGSPGLVISNDAVFNRDAHGVG